MQPYIFPYIGYFQLINAVDKFVIYDDVNYIKQGWINRNNILINGVKSMFTIPLEGAGSNKLIYELAPKNLAYWNKNFIKTIEQNYKKAPFFSKAFDIVRTVFDSNYASISELNYCSIKSVVEYLDIKTQLIKTSRIYENKDLQSEKRVIDICLKERAEEYINAIGGTSLYSRDNFLERGLKLCFLKSDPIVYHQSNKFCIQDLSMIDVMMFNSPAVISGYLAKYKLI
ncbi:WbqC family protein [Hymenobacter qilianensis]|nr:WbqC family protein [Hymenobacter qilianensis]